MNLFLYKKSCKEFLPLTNYSMSPTKTVSVFCKCKLGIKKKIFKT